MVCFLVMLSPLGESGGGNYYFCSLYVDLAAAETKRSERARNTSRVREPESSTNLQVSQIYLEEKTRASCETDT